MVGVHQCQGKKSEVRREILLLAKYLNPATAELACINTKEREEKKLVRRAKKRRGIKAQRGKSLTISQTVDALIWDEEQNGNQNKQKKKY